MSSTEIRTELLEAVRPALDRLLSVIAIAQTREDLERDGAAQLALLLGLETAKRLRPVQIEALYLIFEEAVQARLAALSHT